VTEAGIEHSAILLGSMDSGMLISINCSRAELPSQSFTILCYQLSYGFEPGMLLLVKTNYNRLVYCSEKEGYLNKVAGYIATKVCILN
jgi:hypothetical protein